MAIRRFVVPVTTDESGDATAYSPVVYGHLVSFRYIKDDFDNAVDFVITTETTAQTLWAEENVTASATRHPRAATHSVAGAASVYASAAPVNAKIAISGERVKVVIASGGDTTSGEFHITIDG